MYVPVCVLMLACVHVWVCVWFPCTHTHTHAHAHAHVLFS